LEFSTVIVIIFALLTLGILGILEGREIATILTAIAGYVLGKATATTKQPKKDISSSSSISIVGKVTAAGSQSTDRLRYRYLMPLSPISTSRRGDPTKVKSGTKHRPRKPAKVTSF
jgi:hypothetical protein